MRGILFILCLVIPSLAWGDASFVVAPGIVEFDLSRPRTQSFLVRNNGDEHIRLSLKPIYFELQSKELGGGNPFDPENTGHDDLSPHIRVSPRVVSLKPGQKRNVRVSIRAPKDLLPGDYRAHLLISIIDSTQGIPIQQEESNGLTMQINMRVQTAVAIYGRVGKAEQEVSWQCRLEEENPEQPPTFLLTSSNRTPWRFSGWIGLFPADKAKKLLDSEPVFHRFVSFRESERDYRVQQLTAKAGDTFLMRWGHQQDALTSGEAFCQL